MMPLEVYTLRIYSRGSDESPAPRSEQPLVLEHSVHAIEGTAGELLGNYAVDPKSPTLACIAHTGHAGGMGGAFWAPDERSAAVVVGVELELPAKPLHGFRVEWERHS
jgi:hypothetical protein